MPDEVVTTPNSTPTEGDTSVSGAAPTSVATPQGATPPVTPAPATPSTPSGQEGWVPSYRLREAREAATRQAQETFAQREAQLQTELGQIRSQLHALVGVQPAPHPEVEAVRQNFAQLYPGLSRLEERAQDVMALIERAGDLEQQTQHYWQSYGKQNMDRLFEHAASSLGAPLSEEAKRALHTSFVGFVQSSPEMIDRYAQDPTLVEEFWKLFTSSFVDPVRRAATATVAGRAASTPALPQDTPAGMPGTTPVPKLKDLDERASAGWTLYQQRHGNQG